MTKREHVGRMSDTDVVGIGTHEVVTIDTFGNESDLFDLARIDESLLDERIVDLSTLESESV